MIYTCSFCKKEFKRRGNKRPAKFCSIDCRSKGYQMSPEKRELARQRLIKRNKENNPMTPEQARKNFSKVIPKRGKDHYRWNGGKKISCGYRKIKCEEHPRADGNGYVLESILVMEAYLGRFLDKQEVVHHIDGNKLNNSLYNLKLFTTTGEHTQFHWDNNLWRPNSKFRP